VIHLISSRLHYRFNLAWIQARMPALGTVDGLLPANAQRTPEPKRSPITNGAEWKNDRPVSLPNAKRPKVESVLIYQPETEWTYSHHQSLAFFKGRFYAIWSNGRQDEDAPDSACSWLRRQTSRTGPRRVRWWIQ